MDSEKNSLCNYYERLGIEPDSCVESIKRAYREQTLKFHPDKHGNQRIYESFLAIQEAYETLCDEHQRAQYDDKIGISNLKKTKDKTSKTVFGEKMVGGRSDVVYFDKIRDFCVNTEEEKRRIEEISSNVKKRTPNVFRFDNLKIFLNSDISTMKFDDVFDSLPMSTEEEFKLRSNFGEQTKFSGVQDKYLEYSNGRSKPATLHIPINRETYAYSNLKRKQIKMSSENVFFLKFLSLTNSNFFHECPFLCLDPCQNTTDWIKYLKEFKKCYSYFIEYKKFFVQYQYEKVFIDIEMLESISSGKIDMKLYEKISRFDNNVNSEFSNISTYFSNVFKRFLINIKFLYSEKK